MTVEFREKSQHPNGHLDRTYRNEHHFDRVKIDIRNLPKDTNVAPLSPSKSKDGKKMEVSCRKKVMPYRLEAHMGPIKPHEVPIFILRHVQFQNGLPVTLFDQNDRAVNGILSPMDDPSYSI